MKPIKVSFAGQQQNTQKQGSITVDESPSPHAYAHDDSKYIDYNSIQNNSQLITGTASSNSDIKQAIMAARKVSKLRNLLEKKKNTAFLSLNEIESQARQQEIEEEMRIKKLEEIKAKAKGKLRRHESIISQNSSINLSQEYSMKKGSVLSPTKTNQEKSKNNFEKLKVDDMQAQEAVDFINQIIKRDNKPSNPERKIMTRLYDKMNQVKVKVPKLTEYQKQLKEQAQVIKDKVGPRGMMLDNQVELCSITALYNIDTALKQIDYAEQENPNQKKLSSLQRNRMALNFMEMNEQPKKYKYYERFIDSNIDELEINKNQDQLNQKPKNRNKTSDKTFQQSKQKLLNGQGSFNLTMLNQSLGSINEETIPDFIGISFDHNSNGSLDQLKAENPSSFADININELNLISNPNSKLQSSYNFAFGIDQNNQSGKVSLTALDTHIASNTFAVTARNINNSTVSRQAKVGLHKIDDSIQQILPPIQDQSYTFRSNHQYQINPSQFSIIQPSNSKGFHRKTNSQVTPQTFINKNLRLTNLSTVDSNFNFTSSKLDNLSIQNSMYHRMRERVISTIANPNKYLQKSLEVIEKDAVDTLSYHTALKEKNQLQKQQQALETLKTKQMNQTANLFNKGGSPNAGRYTSADPNNQKEDYHSIILNKDKPQVSPKELERLNMTSIGGSKWRNLKARSWGVTPNKKSLKKRFFSQNKQTLEDIKRDYDNVSYKGMLEDVLKEADFMKTVVIQEKTRGKEGDPRFKILDSAFEKINYFQYMHNLEKSQLAEISARLKELVILKNERRYNLK